VPAGEERVEALEEGVVAPEEKADGSDDARGVKALFLETFDDVQELDVDLGREGEREGGMSG
jgi:hypothetical protein